MPGSTIHLKQDRKYRVFTYAFCLTLTSFFCVYYLSGIILLISIIIILISILFTLKKTDTLDAIVLPIDDSYYELIENKVKTNFWLVKRKIIISDWVYIFFMQDGSNKKIKIWLHKSNFVEKNDIRTLAKNLLLS
ncbi:hypothetical protein [Francisella frigiditurris]|uniref:Uncharacterized protein n=1 Tax=Francisella frigiditurris TaxID=1542390 RepID=A0A1J0KUK6_9GAMM|nr:hypothetical protein [Francisella frigiditurris]APC97453.1 hypothetical protein KX01_1137 [Francisella frigiditurris]